MQNSPPLLFSKLFPLPATRVAAFGQQNLSVFDIDDACFEKERRSESPSLRSGGGAGNSNPASPSSSSSSSGYAPCSIFALDPRNGTSSDDCIVSIAAIPPTSSLSADSKPYRVHFVRPSTATPRWTQSSFIRSTSFAPGTVGPVRGCEVPHLMELLVEQDEVLGEGELVQQQQRLPRQPQQQQLYEQRHSCAIVRQWLSPDGRKVAMHVDCTPSRAWQDARAAAQAASSGAASKRASASMSALVSLLLIFDSFAIPDTAGACGWYLLACVKLPSGESIPTPSTSPQNQLTTDEQTSGAAASTVRGAMFPEQPPTNNNTTSSTSNSNNNSVSFFNSELGSIVGGFVSNAVFVLGWNEHSLNVQLCGDKAGVIVRMFKYRDPAAQEKAPAAAAKTSSEGADAASTASAPAPQPLMTIPSWLVTSSSSISDDDACNLHFMHIHRVRYAVMSLASSAVITQRHQHVQLGCGGGATTAAACSVSPPCMLIQFRVRYSASTTSLLRTPHRHAAIAESLLTNQSSIGGGGSSSSNNNNNNSNSAGGGTVSSRDLMSPTLLVTQVATPDGGSGGGFGAALLRGAAALLSGNGGSGDKSSASTTSGGGGSGSEDPPGTTVMLLHKRIERIFSSSCCFVADSIMASQQIAMNSESGDDNSSFGGSSSGGSNAVTSVVNAVTPGVNSNYSLVWERTASDVRKLHLFAGAKKSFFVSRESVLSSNPASLAASTSSAVVQPPLLLYAAVLPTPTAPDSGGPAEPALLDQPQQQLPHQLQQQHDFYGAAVAATKAPASAAAASDCVVDLFRSGPHSVVAVSLMDEQRVRVCYISDKLNVIDIHFSVNSFFARREQAPQLLYTVQLPASFMCGARAVDINNSNCASIGIMCNGKEAVVVQLPTEKML